MLSRVPYGNIYPPAGLQACGYCDGNLRGYRGREVQGGPVRGNHRPTDQSVRMGPNRGPYVGRQARRGLAGGRARGGGGPWAGGLSA